MAMTLKAARVNAGLTQEEAGLKIGVSPDTILSWEKGKTFPDVRQIKLIEDMYGVPYADIDFILPEDSV